MTDSTVEILEHVFHDPELGATYARRGYVIVDFLDQATVDQLSAAAVKWDSGVDLGFEATMFSPDPEYRRRVDEFVRECFSGPTERYLKDFEAMLGTFVIKHPAGPASAVPLHQDWAFVDESRDLSLNVWVPLQDVDPHNGCLHAIPFSHRLPYFPRSPYIPSPYPPFREELEARLVPLPMRTGQAFIYDMRLLHASPPNQSEQTRLGAATICTSTGAKLLHYYRDPQNEVALLERYEVEAEFFSRCQIGQPPAGAKLVGQVRHPLPDWDAGQVLAMLDGFESEQDAITPAQPHTAN